MHEHERIANVLQEWENQGGDAARLIGQKRWVCWRKVPKKNDEGFSKPPIDPKTGRKIDIRTPVGRANLITGKEALAAYESGRCDGIGIATGDFDGIPLCGIDLDHCLGEGMAINEQYREALSIMGATGYFEVSPSGTGVRGFALCRKPDGYRVRNNAAGVEVYFDGQYMTLTGNRPEGANKPLNADDTAARYLCEAYLKKPVQMAQTSPQEREPPPQYDRLETGLIHDRTFAALWNGGRPNGNESGDDQALMNKLAYWLDCNEAVMIGAFRASPHAAQKDAEHTKKMERNDYLPRTARRAIQDCKCTASQADEEYRAQRKIASVGQSTLRANERRHHIFIPHKFDDITLGQQFAGEQKGSLLWSTGLGWLVWNGKCWVEHDGELIADEKIQEAILRWEADLLGLSAAKLQAGEKELGDSYAAMAENFKTYRRTTNRVNLIKTAKPHLRCDAASVDAKPGLLNCQNGILDLKTGELLPHNPQYHMTKLSGAAYNPEARFERWEQFLTEIMAGDMMLVRWLQKAVGYALAGDPVEDCLFFLYGPTTRNGKSTFMKVLLRLFGSYSRTARPESIGINRNASASGPSEDIARLRGARLVNMPEPPRDLVLNVALVKSLTGRDVMTARFLHKGSFEFVPQFTLFINTNHLPRVDDVTLFRSGRVFCIPFNVQIPIERQDRHLEAALTTPEAASAVLNWALEGYRMYAAEGLRYDVPEAVRKSTEEYSDLSDTLGQFIQECLIEAPGNEEQSSRIYISYEKWTAANGYKKMGNNKFTMEMRKRGYAVQKTRSGAYFQGVRAKSPFEQMP